MTCPELTYADKHMGRSGDKPRYAKKIEQVEEDVVYAEFEEVTETKLLTNELKE